jgi:hypothetical protein
MGARLRLCSKCILQSRAGHFTVSPFTLLPCGVPGSAVVPGNLLAVRWYSRKSSQDLDYFREQPMVGNLNSNPYLHQQALRSRWPRNDNSRRLNVAILGIPNSGKSTLINKAHARFFFSKTVSCAFFGRLGKNTGYYLRG